MCDMQKMPSREDASCEEDADMNFAAFSALGNAGTHFVTTGGQMPVAKLQQNVPNNGAGVQQVCVAMSDGSVQYMRTMDGGATLQTAGQLISVPISLPGAKPGDPQQTVQIQVLNPALLQAQQQPKYQMQIPIQGFQQGGAVLTVAYTPETSEAGGIQLVGQGLGDAGLQVLAALPPELQLAQAAQAQMDQKEHVPMHQVLITQNQQIIINAPEEKPLNNNTTNAADFNLPTVVVKEECDDNDESSPSTAASDSVQWQLDGNHQDLLKYLSQLPPQQAQALPPSLQQFLRLSTTEDKKPVLEVELPLDEDKKPNLDLEVPMDSDDTKQEPVAEAIFGEDGTLRIQSKKKKKYKKKPPKPARPKPGQVVIAQALDGSPIFCCPECQMAYPDKEQLEIHLIVHKIERRFICGICGAGLKRKEHLERHKLGHNPERPYVCTVCRKGFKRREHLNLHAVIHSGVKTEMCTLCGKGFYRKDHLRKHTRSHDSKRLRDESGTQPGASADQPAAAPDIAPAAAANNILPEITIHIPTSSSTQVPVQINIPQHVMTSLRAAQAAQAQAQASAEAQLDALLAQHT